MRKNKLICILASMTMLVGAGVSVAHNDNVFDVAAAETTETDAYSKMTTSEDGKTRIWDFTSSADSEMQGVTSNGILFVASGSSKVKIKGGILSHKVGAELYIPVPAGSAGKITFLDSNTKTDRHTTLYVNGVASSYKIYPDKTNGSSIDFTANQITTYNLNSYLHFVNTANEMKTKTISITLTTKAFVEKGTKIDPLDVTFNHNYEGSTDYTTKTDDYGYITSTYIPTRTGYDFVGWYTEAGCVNEFNFSNTVSTATTLYAKWDRVFTIAGNGNIVVDGNIADITGLTLTLSNSSNTYTSVIEDATYDFGNVKNGVYTLSINDTTGLVAITSSTTITINEDTDVIGNIVIEASEKMSRTHTWDFSNGLVAGSNANGLVASEDMELKSDGYVQGTNNCKASNNKPTSGAYLTLYVAKAGTLRVNVHFGGTKDGFITCDGNVIAKHTGASSGEDYLFEVNLEANKVYYVYSTGSKIMLNSISYTEQIANPTAAVHYQYDDDENPTAIRFIGELVCDPDYINTITYSFTKDGVPANKEIKVNTVYSSIANQEGFAKKDNTWYVVLVLTGFVSEYQGGELVVTLNVTFRNETSPITVSRTLTLGQ